MRDLEKARSNLTDRPEDLAKGKQIVEKEPLPFEELKLITWHSDESDEEGFKLVSSKKKNRKKKNVHTNKKKYDAAPQPLDGVELSNEDVSKTRSRYNLSKGPKVLTKSIR